MTDQTIQSSVENSIQSRVRDDQTYPSMFSSLLLSMARAGDLLSPWWSKKRDSELRSFWRKSDHLSGAMYAMITKMTTIPIKVVARDMSIKAHVRLADQYTERLLNGSEFGEGWETLYAKFLEDFMGQDNGGFMEVIGGGPKDGPIVGPAIALSHVDAARCTRTGNPEFPIIYTDKTGKMYKLHYTRVIYSSQMPSSNSDMNGVGMSAISRAVNAAQNLIDIAIYKQEKLGSRPTRQFLITQGGLDPEDLQSAITLANTKMNNQGLTRFAKTIAVGSRLIEKADIKAIDMVSLPDGFDEKESTILGMSVISLAFGVDARELFPGMESGASKADAIIQHLKQRGKGPGHTIQVTENQIDRKFLPPFLRMQFDFQDDSEDRQAADIRAVRAQTRERNIQQSVTNTRVERQYMLTMGEITQAQFDELELADGRLPDGVDVKILFHSSDPFFQEVLGNTENSDDERKIRVMEIIINSGNAEEVKKARRALAALQAVERDKALKDAGIDPNIPQKYQMQAKMNKQEEDTTYQDTEKFGKRLPKNTATPPNEPKNYSKELTREEFEDKMEGIVQGLYDEDIGVSDFIDAGIRIVTEALTTAFKEGLEEVGISVESINEEETATLSEVIAGQIVYIPKFAEDIVDAKEDGKDISKLSVRIRAWVNQFSLAKNVAKTLAGKDVKLEWVLGVAEHCKDCEKLNGKVKRASYWDKKGIHPQMRDLKCGGFHCKCSLVETDKPVSRGRLPKLSFE